jgi:hypothetical protein
MKKKTPTRTDRRLTLSTTTIAVLTDDQALRQVVGGTGMSFLKISSDQICAR